MTTLRPVSCIVADLNYIHGGATVSTVQNVQNPTTGYAVAIREFEVSYKGGNVLDTYYRAEDYVKTHRVRTSLPGHFLGIWFDEESDIIYLDVVRTFSDFADAKAFAIAQNQIAFFDLSTSTEHRV